MRTRDEAFARQNAEIGILKRQLRDQERDMNRTRRAAQTGNSSNAIQNGDMQLTRSDPQHDIAINLSEGNHDDYGKIEQVRLLGAVKLH